jgi:hypothetical protein
MRYIILWFVIILAGCETIPAKPGNPLLAVSCPDLTPPLDDTFGATTIALVKTSEQYYKCRAAALGGEK